MWLCDSFPFSSCQHSLSVAISHKHTRKTLLIQLQCQSILASNNLQQVLGTPRHHCDPRTRCMMRQVACFWWSASLCLFSDARWCSLPTNGKGRSEGLVAHDCGYPLSRYTCRATRVAPNFLDFIVFSRCSTGVALHPLKILVSHLPPPWCREVSHRKLGLKRCRATRGCRSYSCGCRATLCN